jgi:hypothetical protein
VILRAPFSAILALKRTARNNFDYYCLHLLRVSVSEVLQVYFTPDEFTPVAPAGAQNAPGEIGDCEAVGHFFLYPAGHLGDKPVIFLVILPFIQVMVGFLSAAAFASAF